MNQLIGFLLLLLTVSLALIILDSYHWLLDPYSLGLVLGCVLGVVFLSYGTRAFRIFTYANQPVKNQKEYFWVISFFDNLINTSVITGVIGSVIGMVSMLSMVEDVAGLHSASAKALLPFIYGFVLAKLVLEPLKQNVLRRAKVANINTNVQRQIEQNNRLAHQFTVLGLANIASVFVILLMYV